ncbi:MAG: hypothetical protein H7Z14_03530 [Anaerolineae bacterium]|nr:hypothetical protein [Phycisphaerae bacterium]
MRDLKFAAALVVAALMIGCNKDEATPATPPAPSSPSSPAKPSAELTTPAPSATNTPVVPATPPAAAANDASAAAVTKANELLQQGLNYVKENKLDLAEKTLTQLDGMKGSLPADWPPRIDQLRSAIQAAKLGSGKLPGLPK